MLCMLTGDPSPVQTHQSMGAGHGVTFEALAPSIRFWTPDSDAKSGREPHRDGGVRGRLKPPERPNQRPWGAGEGTYRRPCNLQH